MRIEIDGLGSLTDAVLTGREHLASMTAKSLPIDSITLSPSSAASSGSPR